MAFNLKKFLEDSGRSIGNAFNSTKNVVQAASRPTFSMPQVRQAPKLNQILQTPALKAPEMPKMPSFNDLKVAYNSPQVQNNPMVKVQNKVINNPIAKASVAPFMAPAQIAGVGKTIYNNRQDISKSVKKMPGFVSDMRPDQKSTFGKSPMDYVAPQITGLQKSLQTSKAGRDIKRGFNEFYASSPQWMGGLAKSQLEKDSTKIPLIPGLSNVTNIGMMDNPLISNDAKNKIQQNNQGLTDWISNKQEVNRNFIANSDMAKQESQNDFAKQLGGGAASLSTAAVLSAATKSNAPAGFLFGAMKKGQVYDEARAKGASPEKADAISTAAGATEGVLEKIGLDVFFSKLGTGSGVSNYVANSLVKATSEGLQEGSQELGSNWWAKVGYDKDMKLSEGVFEAALMGATLGIAGGGSASSVQQNMYQKARESGLSHEDSSRFVDVMTDKVQKAVEKSGQYIQDHPPGATIKDVSEEPATKTPTADRLLKEKFIQGTYKGKPYTTNSYYLEFDKTVPKGAVGKQINATGNKAPTSQAVQEIMDKTAGATELKHIGTDDGATSGVISRVFVNETGTSVTVDPEYINYFAKKYPDAKFLLSDTKYAPVLVKSGSKDVGVIMPLQGGDTTVDSYVADYLKKNKSPELAQVESKEIDLARQIDQANEALAQDPTDPEALAVKQQAKQGIAQVQEVKKAMPAVSEDVIKEATENRAARLKEDGFVAPVDNALEKDKTLYRGSKGEVSEETPNFRKVKSFDGDQMSVLQQMSDNGNTEASKILQSSNKWQEADKFMADRYKGYDAIRYSNSTRPQVGAEYHDLKTGKFYAENKDTASVYAKQNRGGKYEKSNVIETLNPTGGVFVDYSPESRMKMGLGKNITTLDKTSGKPSDEMVTIYRGAPTNQKEIAPGDFVTTNYDLAKSYTGEGNVIEKQVKMSDVLDDSTEPLGEEYIYRPVAPKLSEPVKASNPIVERVSKVGKVDVAKEKSAISKPKKVNPIVERVTAKVEVKPSKNSGVEKELKVNREYIARPGEEPKNLSTARKFVTGGDKILKRSGQGGVKLEQAIQEQRRSEDLLRGRWNEHIDRALEGLSKEELANVDNLLRGEADQETGAVIKPLNAKTAGAAKSLRNWYNSIGKTAETMGFEIQTKDGKKVPFKMREDYAPQMYKVSEFTKGKRRQEALDHLVKSGQARNLGEATKLLDDFIVQNGERRFGNLEKAREINLPGFVRDPRIYSKKYAQSIAKRFTEVDKFGKKDETAAKYIDQIAQEKGDYNEAQRIFDYTTKGPESNKFVNAVTQYNLATQLDLAAITNATQSLNTATKAGGINTIKGAIKGFTKEGKAIANQAGVYDDIVNIQEQGMELNKVVELIMWPFQKVENFNRRTAANTGAIRAKQLSKQTSEYAKRELARLGVDPKSIESGKLTKDDMLKAAYEMARQTQFKVNPVDVPPSWKTPVGKLATQFQSFSFMQTKFIRDEVLKEAAKKNYAPLARFLPLAITASYLSTMLRNAVTGREPKEEEKNMDIRAWDKWGKAFGDFASNKIIQGKFLYDTYTNDYNTPLTKVTRTLSSIGGPTVGKVGTVLTALEAIPGGIEKNKEAAISIAKGTKEKVDPYLQAKRFAAGEIPFVGERIKNTAFAFPKSKYSADQKGQFAKDEFDQGNKVVSIGLSRGELTQEQADKQREKLKKVFQKSTGKTIQDVLAKSGNGRIQQDSNGFGFMNDKGDWVVKDTLKAAEQEVGKMDFDKSGKAYEVKGDVVYRRNAEGNIVAQPKSKFDYQVGTAELVKYKVAGDLKAWMTTAEKQLNSIQTQLKDPSIDPLDAIQLQNDAQSLVDNIEKYSEYGGFKKPKSGSAAKSKLSKMLDTSSTDAATVSTYKYLSGLLGTTRGSKSGSRKVALKKIQGA